MSAPAALAASLPSMVINRLLVLFSGFGVGFGMFRDVSGRFRVGGSRPWRAHRLTAHRLTLADPGFDIQRIKGGAVAGWQSELERRAAAAVALDVKVILTPPCIFN